MMKSKAIEDLVTNRDFFNKKVLEELSLYLDKHKELRFIQALWTLGIINKDDSGNIEDRFFEESHMTLERMVPTIKEERKK